MKRWVIILSLFLSALTTTNVLAQVATEPREVKATITNIQDQVSDGKHFYNFEAKDSFGEIFKADTTASYPNGLFIPLKIGDRVRLRIVENPDGTQSTFFDDKIRTGSLAALFFIFAVIAIAIGFFRGLFSLIGLAFTLIVLFWFLFPQILAGRDPILMTVLASIVILFVNIHLSHGLRVRTFFSFLGTVAGLFVVVVLSYIFTHASSLSGVGTEESTFLLWEIKTIKDPVALFIAAVILGTVGVLDDVAVTQSEVVGEMLEVDSTLSRKDLFFRAMRVGRHHIASTVNTLVLVYAGAALPIFLLFFSSSSDVGTFLNNQAVAEEFVRTIVGTISLMLTVPFATAFATIPRSKHAKEFVDIHSKER
ncbi:YibE/F family protein [Candidatus Uhrbacteria bacterium]|nr:YibE/F family protein [Candidatus Uhrbacteria bacterium]